MTVVLATRDRAWVLPRALRSVLEQTAGDLELVVVDDGSTDATPALLDGVDDPRLVRVRTPGLGVAAARNAGVAAGSAPLVAHLDDDNTWSPRFLEVMRAEIGEAVLAYCSQHVFLARRAELGKHSFEIVAKLQGFGPGGEVGLARGEL